MQNKLMKSELRTWINKIKNGVNSFHGAKKQL